jgi:hypothetical protein
MKNSAGRRRSVNLHRAFPQGNQILVADAYGGCDGICLDSGATKAG